MTKESYNPRDCASGHVTPVLKASKTGSLALHTAGQGAPGREGLEVTDRQAPKPPKRTRRRELKEVWLRGQHWPRVWETFSLEVGVCVPFKFNTKGPVCGYRGGLRPWTRVPGALGVLSLAKEQEAITRGQAKAVKTTACALRAGGKRQAGAARAKTWAPRAGDRGQAKALRARPHALRAGGRGQAGVMMARACALRAGGTGQTPQHLWNIAWHPTAPLKGPQGIP